MRAASIITALLFTIVLAAPSFAHRVNIFAWIEGNTVYTESTFSSGRRAQHSQVTVTDKATGNVIASGTTDQNGEWSFSLPPEVAASKTPMLISLTAGQGHANSWTLESDDFPDTSVATVDTTTKETEITNTPQPAQTVTASNTQEAITVTKAELAQIVRNAVNQELTPLKGQLAKLDAELRQPKTTFKDIFGGIGYILGLLGLAAYMRYRKQG